MDRQVSLHKNRKVDGHSPSNSNSVLLRPFSRTSSGTALRSLSNGSEQQLPLLAEQYSYGSTGHDCNTIRFQVVVWYIGKLDVVTGSLPMTFRVTLFWNDTSNRRKNGGDDCTSPLGQDDEEITLGEMSSQNSFRIWKMQGRQKAIQQEVGGFTEYGNDVQAIPVPALSILNVATFEIIGSPEIDMLQEDTRLMRWTCMYRATVVQQDLSVDQFPHDLHNISLHLAILNDRRRNQQWDRRYWKLALANANDTQNSTRIPHGLVVDQVRVPDFHYNRDRGLEFDFQKLNHGIFDTSSSDESSSSTDTFLKVSICVLRDSGYYDKNIVPLLALLNCVAVSVVTMEDKDFFSRSLLTMNIAFVEMGIRMTTDSHLPSVGYEIRLQRILNEFFFVLMLLLLCTRH